MIKLNKIYCIDVLDGLKMLDDNSIDCVVTSPPYWGLRDYGIEGQLGLEKTPEEYVQKLVDVFHDVKRVLKKEGTVWLNLGDSYAGSGSPGGDFRDGRGGDNYLRPYNRTGNGLKQKDLVGIPWRCAFALQSDGWWLRQDIIWSKPNIMPESVTDRCTKSHEYIFLFAKNQHYYYDAEAIKEEGVIPRGTKGAKGSKERLAEIGVNARPPEYQIYDGKRNKRDVWTITTKPFKGAHFATFPEDLIEPMIKAGTSEKGICPSCGKPWIRIIERQNKSNWDFRKTKGATGGSKETGNKQQIGSGWSHNLPSPDNKTLGWQPSCQCDKEPITAIVLDPFIGSGTTGLVARKLLRNYIGFELNQKYVTMANKRLEKIPGRLL